ASSHPPTVPERVEHPLQDRDDASPFVPDLREYVGSADGPIRFPGVAEQMADVLPQLPPGIDLTGLVALVEGAGLVAEVMDLREELLLARAKARDVALGELVRPRGTVIELVRQGGEAIVRVAIGPVAGRIVRMSVAVVGFAVGSRRR